MNPMNRAVLALAVLAFPALVLSGCNQTQIPADGITLTATPLGSGANVRYKFSGTLKTGSSGGTFTTVPVTLDTDFHTGYTYQWHPTLPGAYTLTVTACDVTFNTTYTKTLAYTLYASSLTGIIAVTAMPASNTTTLAQLQAHGGTVHFAVSIGGDGAGVLYKYQVTRPGSAADPISDYTSNNYLDLTPLIRGTYSVKVIAYDATYNTSFSKTVSYVVK